MRTSSLPIGALRPFALAAILIAAAMALFLQPSGRAGARGVWCSGDPAIIVNGSVVSITAHVPLDRLQDVEQAEFVFHVPSNAKVTGVINDSLLFKASITVKKDLPAARGLTGTPVKVDMRVHHRGEAFPIAATTLSVGWGTDLWVEGSSNQTLRIDAVGLLDLRLF